MTNPRSGDPLAPRPATPSAPAPASAPLDRAALERVLARAAELQSGHTEPAERLSEAELLEIGKEVGIGSEHVRLALAEERTRVEVPQAAGVVGGLFGATGVSASRVVSGTPTELLGRLDEWMQREEALRPKRRFSDRLTWESRKDLMGQLQTGLNLGGRSYGLAGSDDVGATVVPVDATRSVVRLDASFVEGRKKFMLGSSIAAGGGVVGATGIMALATLIPEGSLFFGALVASAPLLGGGAIAAVVASAQRKRLARAQLALEQILDRLERGEIRKPSNPLTDLIDTVARKVEGIR